MGKGKGEEGEQHRWGLGSQVKRQWGRAGRCGSRVGRQGMALPSNPKRQEGEKGRTQLWWEPTEREGRQEGGRIQKEGRDRVRACEGAGV